VQLTIDTSQNLDDVVRVVGALYNVQLGVVEATTPTTVAAPRGRSRSTSGRRSAASRRGASRRSGRRPNAGAVSTAEVRAWAQTNGYPVNSRGRIPATVKTAFDASRS
jgi:hypothetical protein